MQAWKMVDACHADSVARGILRIGTLENYRSLENGRADDREGVVTINSGVLMHGFPEDEDAMTRSGLGRAMLIVNSRREDRQRPTYAFCMAEVGCRFDWTPTVRKTIFRVKAVRALARLIAEKYSDRIEASLVGRVRYGRTSFQALEPEYETSSPFLKDLRFAPEREIRIIWKPRSEQPEPFCTDPDSRIAELLSLVSFTDKF